MTQSQKKFTKFTSIFLSFTIALCLLSSSSRQSTASPVPKSIYKQRSIAQQVHHVQFGDESVHNTLVLIKKSIQKKRQTSSSKPSAKKLMKRQLVVADTAIENKSEILSKVDPSSLDNTDSSSSSSSSSSPSASPASSVPSKKSHARLISAYETIVFSESQIPVFLSQEHAVRRRPSFKASAKKGKYIIIKEPSSQEIVNDGIIQSSPIGVEIPSLFKRDISFTNEGEIKKEGSQSCENEEKTGSVMPAVDPLSPITSANSENLDDHELEYENFGYMYHGCTSNPAIVMILLSIAGLVLYRIRVGSEQYQLLPTSSPSYDVTTFEINNNNNNNNNNGDSKVRDSRRASETIRENKSHYVGCNVE